MKGLPATLAISIVFLIIAGTAFGQGYYGYSDPGQNQGYGSYGGNDQGQAGYEQYGQQSGSPQGYEQYGQQYGSPQGYGQYGQQEGGYGQQNAPQGYAGYQNQNYQNQNYQGYGAYGGQYGQSPGYGAPSTSTRRPAARHRNRPAPTASYNTVQPQTSYTPSTGNRTSRTTTFTSTDTEQGTNSEVYWDGRESVPSEGEAPQVQQQPVVQTPPAASPVVRPPRAAASTPAVQSPRRTRQNVVRQTAAPTPPPPAKRNVKWGKEEKAASEGSVTWGKQDKPTAVTAEPGFSQGTRVQGQSTSSPAAQMESMAPSKRFQWGKTN